MRWRALISAIFSPSSTISADLQTPSLTYLTDGRSGTVRFTAGRYTFDMYVEFGGGDTLAIVDVPTADRWTRDTGIPLALRPCVLTFIGDQVVRDQTTEGRGRFVLQDDCIRILSAHR